MKNFLIRLNKGWFILAFMLIIISGLWVRFYNFEDRITFGSEQARSLVVSANYLKYKPSLLGQEYFRVNSKGHKLFAGSLFNYSLVPLLILFKYDPTLITAYFAVLNIATGLVIYYLVKKMTNKHVALISLTLFIFNSYMAYHSMFIWILNYLPLVGMLSLYLTWKIFRKKAHNIDFLLLGILSGIGFGMEYLYILAVIPVVYFLIRYAAKKITTFTLFLLGSVLGDITQVIFDLKHDFYHLKTLWQYTLDTIHGVSGAGFIYYHFLDFWPLFILIAALIIYRIGLKNKLASVLIICLYLIVNLNSSLINYKLPVGMPEHLNISKIKEASKLIADKTSGSFNVATLYDFDTRGYVLRYFVEYVYKKTPLGELEYPISNELYTLSHVDYKFDSVYTPWELNVFKPYNIEIVGDIGGNFVVSRITRK